MFCLGVEHTRFKQIKIYSTSTTSLNIITRLVNFFGNSSALLLFLYLPALANGKEAAATCKRTASPMWIVDQRPLRALVSVVRLNTTGSKGAYPIARLDYLFCEYLKMFVGNSHFLGLSVTWQRDVLMMFMLNLFICSLYCGRNVVVKCFLLIDNAKVYEKQCSELWPVVKKISPLWNVLLHSLSHNCLCSVSYQYVQSSTNSS